jgi:dolichol-phosphate mannosyltransferase
MAISKDEVTIVIPTFNEEKAIGMVLDEVRAAGYENILVIDGYSVDATVKIAESRRVQVVQQNGRGKTGAIRTAVDFVKTPYILVMDGDYTYCAKDIERFLNHGGRYVHVVGVRDRANMGLIHRFGNWIITRTFNLLLGAGLSDVCSGMYLLRTDVARELELQSKGFRTEVEVVAQTVMDGNVTEVPVSYRPRVGKRKLSTWRHGFEILAAILGLARRYNPVLLFSAIAGLSIFPASIILAWAGLKLLLFGVFHSWWAMTGLVLLLLAFQALAVSTVSILLKRMERRIMRSLKKE